MWKILVGFIVFAAIAVFLLMKGGADVDMSGEKHGAEPSAETTHEAAEAPSAPVAPAAPASEATPEAASAASH